MADELDTHTVIIPIPTEHQKNYGVHATSYAGATRLMQRYSEADSLLIKEQAARIQVSIATFIRESALNMAKALRIQQTQHEKEKDNAKHELRSG